MKKFFSTAIPTLFAAAVVALLLSASPVRGSHAPVASAGARPAGTISIVTTIRPLELIVRGIVSEDLSPHVAVSSLLSPDISPHGFEPTPGQMARLAAADMVVLNGLGLDDWAARRLPPKVRIMRLADHAAVAEAHDEHDHHEHHDDEDCDHHHGPVDEHLWLDAAIVAAFAPQFTRELVNLLDARLANGEVATKAVTASRDRFLEQVREADTALAERLKPYRQRRIVTHHDVFRRITQRYGLGEPIVLRPLAAGEPTARDLRRAIRAIRADQIKAILVEPQFNPVAAQRIREETQVRLVPVDPLGSEAASWRDLMNAIAAAIVQSFDE